MPERFHVRVPISRRDTSKLDPQIAAAFAKSHQALSAAMDICNRGSDPDLEHGPVEYWFESVEALVSMMAEARMALAPVAARTTKAYASRFGNNHDVPEFGGFVGDSAHDVAVKIVGDVVSICHASYGPLPPRVPNDPAQHMRRAHLAAEKFRNIHPHLDRFAAIDGERLEAMMWTEAVAASGAVNNNQPTQTLRLFPDQPFGEAERELVDAISRIAKSRGEVSAKHFLDFAVLNPTIIGIPTTRRLLELTERWMLTMDSESGIYERRLLRDEVRMEFPPAAQNFKSMIESIEHLQADLSGQSPALINLNVSRYFQIVSVLDGLIAPEPPGQPADTPAEGFAHLERLRRHCLRRADELSSVPRDAAPQAAPPAASEAAPEGEWSLPMSKAEMANRLKLKPDAFATFTKQHKLRKNGRQQFQIRLDTMDANTRKAIEQKK